MSLYITGNLFIGNNSDAYKISVSKDTLEFSQQDSLVMNIKNPLYVSPENVEESSNNEQAEEN